MNPFHLAPAKAGIVTRNRSGANGRSRNHPGQGRGYIAVVLAMLVGVLFGAGPQRPRDPWVFRCVLDENPRMVVIALHEDLWLAYDAATCSVYKVWQGGVNFDGAVYTTVHGPQPTSQGDALFNGPIGDVWRITHANASQQPNRISPQWKGYSLHDDKMTLHYRFALPGGGHVDVRESPEVLIEDDAMSLQRRFVIDDMPDDISVELVADRYEGDVNTPRLEAAELTMTNAVVRHESEDRDQVETTLTLREQGVVVHRFAEPSAKEKDE